MDKHFQFSPYLDVLERGVHLLGELLYPRIGAGRATYLALSTNYLNLLILWTTQSKYLLMAHLHNIFCL